MVHGSALDRVPDSYKRYLEGYFRNAFHLAGTPMSIEFRTGRNPYAGAAAAWALGEIESVQGIAPLEPLVRDPALDVRKTTIWALGQIEDGSGVAPAAAALRDADPEVRVLAAWALGEIEDARAVTPLVAALKDSDVEVRATASIAFSSPSTTGWSAWIVPSRSYPAISVWNWRRRCPYEVAKVPVRGGEGARTRWRRCPYEVATVPRTR